MGDETVVSVASRREDYPALGRQPLQRLVRRSSEETTGLYGGTDGEQNGTCCQQRALHDCLQEDALAVAQTFGRPSVKRIGEADRSRPKAAKADP